MKRIYDIAGKAGYSRKFIDKIIFECNNSNRRVDSQKTDLRFGGIITYLPGFSEKIVNIGRKFGVKIVYEAGQKLNSCVARKVDTVDSKRKNGVYEIPYINLSNDKKGFYIGMTERSLSVRLNEHIRYVKQGKSTTALSRLKAKEDLNIDFNNAKIITPFTSKYKTLITESIEIMTRKEQVCNESTSFEVNNLWKRVIAKLAAPGEERAKIGENENQH